MTGLSHRANLPIDVNRTMHVSGDKRLHCERRARQAEAIKTWKPWQKSTGPRSAKGKAIAAQNGFKGGDRGRLRELSKELTALFRDQRELLQELVG